MSSLTNNTQLPLEEQIAQMIVVRASGYLLDRQIRFPQWEPDHQTLRYWLETLNIGGVVLLGGSAVEVAQRSAQLQNWAKTPLLIAADIEEGVGQRFAGATWFPPPMALGDIAKSNLSLAKQYARNMGAVTAQEALATGINWLLAPVVDINNNPDNPVINVRAFAETPETVSQLSGAFIEGANQYSVLTTAKHFPGHGDTATDSHLALPILEVAQERLQQIELPPFQNAIAQGVDGVMSAHLLVPSWDTKQPATLSSKSLREQLRGNLGFEGLIVTDALIMGSLKEVASSEELPVFAIEAGADIVLMPADPEAAIASIMTAVNKGRLSRERIAASVERIRQAKAKVETASRPNWLTELATTNAEQTKVDILKASLQTSENLPLPLPNAQKVCRNLIIVDDLLNCGELDRNHSAIALPEQLGYQLQLVGQAQVFPESPSPSPLTLVQLFTRGNPFRGESGLNATAKQFLQGLFQQQCVQAVIVYGSPYVLNWLKPNLDGNVPWIFSYGQMSEASAIALGQLFDLSQLPRWQEDIFL